MGKRLRKINESFDKTKHYTVPEAVDILLSADKPKFDETVDVAVNLNIDTRHANQQVRSAVSFACWYR